MAVQSSQKMTLLSTFLLLVTLLCSTTRADPCYLKDDGQDAGTTEDNPALCLPQGEGAYTFAMSVGLGNNGLTTDQPGSQPALVNGYSFHIYDNTCKRLGHYTTGECSAPFHIQGNFLKYELIVDNVWADPADPYYSFLYANGKYSIKSNHCVCNDSSKSFFQIHKGCRCAFPVNGQPTKRSISFEA